jgi:hypothetical protein
MGAATAAFSHPATASARTARVSLMFHASRLPLFRGTIRARKRHETDTKRARFSPAFETTTLYSETTCAAGKKFVSEAALRTLRNEPTAHRIPSTHPFITFRLPISRFILPLVTS